MFKVFSSFIVTAVIALGSASVLAQDPESNDRRATTSNDRRPATTTTARDDDGDFNYGWLGLAGALGLLGLLPRNRDQGVTVRDGAGNVKQSRA